MGNYKLNRIYLENFKLIKNSIVIEGLSESDLIVFDGPNGFGKTTVFDALEIALTGQVFRIMDAKIVPKGQGAIDCVFLNDQTRPMKIVIEFIKDNEKKILLVFGNRGNNLNATERKADNKNYFKRYELTNFEDYSNFDVSKYKNELTQEEINNWFNNADLERYYKLYHYIQQAETTFFLKQKEDERMKQLGVLFDTQKEENESLKIQGYLDAVNTEIKELTEQLTTKKTALSLVETDQSSENTISPKTTYKKIFNDQEYSPEWDNENLTNIRVKDSNGITKRDIYKTEINRIIDFLKTFDENILNYKNTNHNLEIDDRLKKQQTIKDALQCLFFIDKIPEIKVIFEKQKLRVKYREMLTKENILQDILKIDIRAILSEFSMDDQFDLIQSKIKQIEQLKNKESELSEIIREFDNTREKILVLFDRIIKNEPKINDNECPLCGSIYKEGYEELLADINKKKKKIKDLQTDNGILLSTLYEDVFKTHIEPINLLNNSFLDDPKNRIHENFYNGINIDSSRLTSVRNFNDWLNSFQIDLNGLINKDYNKEIHDIDQRLEKSIDILLAAKRNITDSYEHSLFKHQFSEYLASNSENIKLLNVEDLSNKIKFIDQEYFKGNQQEKQSLQIAIEFISNQQLPKLDDIKAKIIEILRVYEDEIQNHRIEIAKNIEIPFFIYSSKILQNFEKGVGVFIQFKQSNKTENLKFTQGMDTSHDALHSMSSGQLSALVIAFTLSMNKIYDESNIGFLLIDDPVQTMDEINMSSLVDLLRNDFTDKQIIVSTHEDDISAFMRFKFYNFGKKTIPINMKTKQFEAIN